MSIEASPNNPAFRALVTAFSSFRMQLPNVSDEKIRDLIARFDTTTQDRILEGKKSFYSLHSMTKATPEMRDDLARLKEILIKACILTNYGQQLGSAERTGLQECMKQYEQLLDDYCHTLNAPSLQAASSVQEAPSLQVEGFRRHLTIKEELEKMTSVKPQNVYTVEATEKRKIPDVADVQAFSAIVTLFSRQRATSPGPSALSPTPKEEAEEGSAEWVRAQLLERRRSSAEQPSIAEHQKSFQTILQRHGGAQEHPDTNLLTEGYVSLSRLRNPETKANILKDFALLRRVLVKSLAYIRQPENLATDEEKEIVLKAVHEYNTLVDDWGSTVDVSEEQKKEFVQSMSLKDEIEQIEHPEKEKATHGAKVEEKHPKPSAALSPRTFKILDQPGLQPLFGKTNFVRYMVKYLLGCKMQEIVEAKAKAGETVAPFTGEDLEGLGLSKILRDAEKTENQRVRTFNDLKIVQKDLTSRAKAAKGPEKRKIEDALAELKKLDAELTEQANKFETISSFMGKDKPLAFATKGQEYATLKQRIELAQRRIDEIRTAFKKK